MIKERKKLPGDYLYSDQRDAVKQMHNGCLLVGGTGAGKTITALAYYFESNGGAMNLQKGFYKPMDICPDLIVITTAKKREDKDWEREMIRFLIKEESLYSHEVIVDSWQNIKKYKDREGAFFIFDEDHLTGSGTWVKTFLHLAKRNTWIVLSATPADGYIEFAPIFIANGYFKNFKDFKDSHVKYDPYCRNYPRIIGYFNTGKLIRLKNRVVVKMKYVHESDTHDIQIPCRYDFMGYKNLCRDKWNIWEDKPMENAAEFCYCLRRYVNSDGSRMTALIDILREKRRVIVFYSYDYELDILKNLDYSGLLGEDVEVAELNGHAHQGVPESEWWVYLVNYAAGAEAWECTTTDTIIFYSQTYSYKTLVQAKGRIDRCNTPFSDLYYYHFVSNSKIDIAIGKALKRKKKFNETMFAGDFGVSRN